MTSLFLLLQLLSVPGKGNGSQTKNAGLEVPIYPEFGQGDATLNFIGLKNVKSFHSENPRSWDFFCLSGAYTPFGPSQCLF